MQSPFSTSQVLGCIESPRGRWWEESGDKQAVMVVLVLVGEGGVVVVEVVSEVVIMMECWCWKWWFEMNGFFFSFSVLF